ncbi:hypothetical protein QYF36_010443 [Acer negundo]|nr:hypothetical protein QYF36_010443 [Acer negundo]
MSGSWNGPFINEIFLEEDARVILSIPSSISSRDDSYCWHFTKYDEYSMSLGYKVCADLDIVESTSGDQGVGFCWDNVWDLNLPLKIKFFIWRACCNWIPMQVNLAQLMVPVSGVCPICSFGYETTFHALLSYPKLKVVRHLFIATFGKIQKVKGNFFDFFRDCAMSR